MTAQLIYTGYANEKPRCIDAISTVLREEGFMANIIGEDQKKKLLDEVVNTAWQNHNHAEMSDYQRKLLNMKIKNLGEAGAKELLGKLAVWSTFVRLG